MAIMPPNNISSDSLINQNIRVRADMKLLFEVFVQPIFQETHLLIRSPVPEIEKTCPLPRILDISYWQGLRCRASLD